MEKFVLEYRATNVSPLVECKEFSNDIESALLLIDYIQPAKLRFCYTSTMVWCTRKEKCYHVKT